jgi:hypothetical protein
MNNVIHIKDWLLKHVDVRDCENILNNLSDVQIEVSIEHCDDMYDAIDSLFKLVEST